MTAKKWILTAGTIALCIVLAFVAWNALQDEVDASVFQSEPLPIRNEIAQSTQVEEKTVPVATVPTPIRTQLAPAQSEAATERLDDLVEWQREVIAGLITIGDADSLMSAALVLHTLDANTREGRRKIATLLLQAHKAAPSDRAIASVGVRVCRAMPGCNLPELGEFMRDADARNALATLPELLIKIEKGLPDEVTEGLTTLGRLHLNLYSNELPARVLRSIESTPTSPRLAPATSSLLRLQSELALRAVNAVEKPNYLSVGPACQVATWRNLRACRAIADDLSRSEVLALQRVGLELSAMMVPNQSGQLAPPSDTEVYLNWISGMRMQNPPPPEQWIPLLAHNPSELTALRAWLESNGIEQRVIPRSLQR